MDVMQGIGREIAAGERVEDELDAFISRRHDRRVTDEGERPTEAEWMESERRHDVRRRAENGAAWRAYHEGQAARHRTVLADLIASHEREAERLQATDERKAV